jgi:hypothetical protein
MAMEAFAKSITGFTDSLIPSYLLVLDKTGWRTNLLTALLVPYLALQLPEPFFGYLRGDIGKWIAFIAVVIRLFFASQFSQTIHGDLELPAAFILLIVVAPSVIVDVRGTVISSIVCLIIGTYLLVQHIKNAGGFKAAFGETRGVAHTVGILLLFIPPHGHSSSGSSRCEASRAALNLTMHSARYLVYRKGSTKHTNL